MLAEKAGCMQSKTIIFKVAHFSGNNQREKFMLSDTQVFLALFVSLITGVLAVRLGTQLYK